MAGDILQAPTLTRKYEDFILSKSHSGGDHGFAPVHLPDYLFDFQAAMDGMRFDVPNGDLFDEAM